MYAVWRRRELKILGVTEGGRSETFLKGFRSENTELKTMWSGFLSPS